MNTGFLCMGHLIYRHIYRQKTNALTGAGDALGLRGGYSSASIVNYRTEPKTIQSRSALHSPFTKLPTINHDIETKSCLTVDQLHRYMLGKQR
ncbi:hypothetical protein [Candidatus Nitrotoga sp. HW29]|jgi:hypothetical protein|uniref:hypothetical protein n=1 Tax=Candidatus Nitrotoga sp. HW29 TaxID=2886963 RepID=UPI001EF282FC|nr:hypothetical protein [Candidatus Nitrotoga sp. HW29]